VAQSPEDGLALNACWAALSAAFLLVTESAQLGLIATPFYVFVGMVVTAYIGGAVVDDHWQQEMK
jgi:hypothetical protein